MEACLGVLMIRKSHLDLKGKFYSGGSGLRGGQAEGAGLRWFGHVKRRAAPVRRGLVVKVPWRGRGRPKKYWGEVIRQDLASPYRDMTLDRKEWRSLPLLLTEHPSLGKSKFSTDQLSIPILLVSHNSFVFLYISEVIIF
ncbi:hypothetical protein H5410_058594 [Solanum commersonii]|uniref:Uncharacterized protein n=1 Tax=Solanum commersonii TaxID=4109 RepID=A0A9J5WTM0_SOLCO|nr:hypothetical protein H5410_058594 [Solanum commersonii]